MGPVIGNLPIHDQRSAGFYGGYKLPMMTNASDMAALNRSYGGNQFMFFPGGTVMGGQPNSYGHVQYGSADQSGALQFMPNGLTGGYLHGNHLMAPALSNFGLPYAGSADVHDVPGHRRSSWSSADENAPNTHNPDMSSSQPTVVGFDRPSMPFYGIQTPAATSAVPYQMMKGTNGEYVMQDLEALLKQDPAVPPAVPAMWTNPSDVTLSKCLENREGITNVYIRGFLPETTDEMLHAFAARFGRIERCKAIIDLDKGQCKGFGFVQFYRFDDCENCIRGFYHLGYQASFAQKSRNARLKDLEDRASTNIYCTNVPLDWAEVDLRRHFHPYEVISEKISRDDRTGVSKEVGFARFETRDIAEKVLAEFHNVTGKDGVKLLLRFADTKAQKQLKQQSNERRAYRAGEYNYSVDVVQGNTPSPIGPHLQHSAQITPASQLSFQSPHGLGPVWTPATSISSRSVPILNKAGGNARLTASWPHRSVLANAENTPTYTARFPTARSLFAGDVSGSSSKTVTATPVIKAQTPGSDKENNNSVLESPTLSRKMAKVSTPKSAC